jgi:hypothetical protein
MMKKKTDITLRSSAAEYLTFIAATGEASASVEMRYEDENIWLTQKMMATLYDVDVRTINYHIGKIFEDAELQADSVIRNFRITATDGKSYDTMHYALQMIIAVDFKVNSVRAVQFRKWVNQIAKDYTIQGWVIREIRLSERKFYQKITDIYATSCDYDRDAKITREFFQDSEQAPLFGTWENGGRGDCQPLAREKGDR